VHCTGYFDFPHAAQCPLPFGKLRRALLRPTFCRSAYCAFRFPTALHSGIFSDMPPDWMVVSKAQLS
jgi:hypothetical protein